MKRKYYVLLREGDVIFRFEKGLSEESYKILTGLFGDNSVYSLTEGETKSAVISIDYETNDAILNAIREWVLILPVIQDSDGFEYCQRELSNIEK